MGDMPLLYPSSSPDSSQSSAESSNDSVISELQNLIRARVDIYSTNGLYHREDHELATSPLKGFPPQVFLKPSRDELECYRTESPSPFLPVLPSKMLEDYHTLQEVLCTPSASPQRENGTADHSTSRHISPLADIANIDYSPKNPFDKALDIFSDLLSTSDSPVLHHSPHFSAIFSGNASASPIAHKTDTGSPLSRSSPISSVGSAREDCFSPSIKTPTRTTPSLSARPSTSPLTPISDSMESSSNLPPKLKIKIKLDIASWRTSGTKRKNDRDHVLSPSKRTRCSLRRLLRESKTQATLDESIGVSPTTPPIALQSGSCPEDKDTQVARPLPRRKHQVVEQALLSFSPPSTSSTDSTSETSRPFTQRSFPHAITPGNFIEISPDLPLFYRRFPASTFFKYKDADSPFSLFKASNPGGTYNPPKSAFDLYTPRFVKGKGREKVGICPICIENVERGGEGKAVWLAMKFSAYNYHMQYMHGISAASALPFLPPLAFRITRRPRALKTEKTVIKEGKCHQCQKWIPVEGVKDMEVKVKEIFWWKHAAACHNASSASLAFGDQGPSDVFEQDDVYRTLKEIETGDGC